MQIRVALRTLPTTLNHNRQLSPFRDCYFIFLANASVGLLTPYCCLSRLSLQASAWRSPSFLLGRTPALTPA
jgi:hypothetical protein